MPSFVEIRATNYRDMASCEMHVDVNRGMAGRATRKHDTLRLLLYADT